MLRAHLKPYRIILASKSPRRHELFKSLDIDFEVILKPVKEVYDPKLKANEITDYLAKLKADQFINTLAENDLLITSDTIVWHENEALGKPKNRKHAIDMLKSMSGKTHEVWSSVCFTTNQKQLIEHDKTTVVFKELNDIEIEYYVDAFQPYDKAGAYGIQDWIGKIAITKLEGSYFNVMGLPIHLVYKTLNSIINS